MPPKPAEADKRLPTRAGPKKPAPAQPAPRDVRLSDRVKLVRNVLPALIVLVVLAVELLIRRLNDLQAEFWAHLIFYGLLGPAVTFFTAEWIAQGTRAREQAERELRALYGQLSISHGRLGAVQELMREVADAPDMAAVVEVGARGAVRAWLIGLPVSSDSRRASSSPLASTRSAIRVSRRARCSGRVVAHSGCAAVAAWTAWSTSSEPERATGPSG